MERHIKYEIKILKNENAKEFITTIKSFAIGFFTSDEWLSSYETNDSIEFTIWSNCDIMRFNITLANLLKEKFRTLFTFRVTETF